MQYSDSLNDLRTLIDRKRGQAHQIERNINQLRVNLRKQSRYLIRLQKALEVIRIVAIKTQKQLQFHISDITSLALESVYDDPYQLVVEFVERRNKTECDLYLTRNGERFDPIDESGGGVVNIASFALRVATLSMIEPKPLPVLLLDEPFNNVSSELLSRVGEMLQQLSKKLGLQIIIITHSEQLIEFANKVFKVTKQKGTSIVEEI